MKVIEQIKSTVKTILIISCKDGLALLKELYSGLSTFKSIFGILIYIENDSLSKEEVDSVVKKLMNEPTIEICDNV